MIPTSIDGTDITGATIDGTDITEITVDGDVVFSAGPNLPVAYSNLVAWYPFDSAEYGGSNADDVTAIIGGSADDTAYNGTVDGATYESSNGITDINAGASSGNYDFDGFNDTINIGSPLNSTNPFTVTAWVRFDSQNSIQIPLNSNDFTNGFRLLYLDGSDTINFETEDNGNNQTVTISGPSVNTYTHYACVFDGNVNELYENGNLGDTTASTGSGGDPVDFEIGSSENSGSGNYFDGQIDDVRIYDTDLSSSEIQDIYDNTKP